LAQEEHAVNAIILAGGKMFSLFKKKSNKAQDGALDLADIEVGEPPADWVPEEVEPDTPVRDWNVNADA
jgi:hypothetical protein